MLPSSLDASRASPIGQTPLSLHRSHWVVVRASIRESGRAFEVKKEIARAQKSTNKSLLSEEAEKLDCIQLIANATKDMAAILSGSGKSQSQDDIVQKTQACDEAGVTLGLYIRAACLKAQVDCKLQHAKCSQVLEMLDEQSEEFKPLKDGGMERDDMAELSVELLEHCAQTLLEAIPEDKHNHKNGIKCKTEVGSFLDLAIESCERDDFLGKDSKEQAQAADGGGWLGAQRQKERTPGRTHAFAIGHDKTSREGG